MANEWEYSVCHVPSAAVALEDEKPLKTKWEQHKAQTRTASGGWSIAEKNSLTKSDGEKAKLEIEMLYRFAKFFLGSEVDDGVRVTGVGVLISFIFFSLFLLLSVAKQNKVLAVRLRMCVCVCVHTRIPYDPTTPRGYRKQLRRVRARELRVSMQFTWVTPSVARGQENTFINLGTWTTSPHRMPAGRSPKPPLLFIMISFQFFFSQFLVSSVHEQLI